MRIVIVIITFISVTVVHGASYIYPIATCQTGDGPALCYVYQRSLSELELWLYNLASHEWQQGLWSRYTPAGVRFSPDKTQFSFIDNGRIRVHTFLKRSPRSLEFEEPIYEIGIPEWSDEEHLYFSAKKNNVFGIFQTDMYGSLVCLIWDGKADYLYPQKIGNQLFAIKRLKSEHNDYWLVRVDYGKDGQPIVLYHDVKPMAFLIMISEHEGFFIRHVGSDNEKMLFEYYHLSSIKDEWYSNQLLKFSIPISLLSGNDRLYESIVPLLPRYYEGVLYYVDCLDNYLALYKYKMITWDSERIVSSRVHYFSPVLIGGSLYYADDKIDVFGLEK